MAAECKSPSCSRPSKCRGLCSGHYARFRNGKPIDTPLVEGTKEERVWRRVDMSGGLDSCWEWRGATTRGYGAINKVVYGEGLVHRYVFKLATGLSPEAVMHECDNPACCNPLHLTAGTRKENNQQAWSRGLHPMGERHTHARLTDAEVAEIRSRAAAGERQTDIARDYGVHQSHVCNIVNFKVRKAA